MTTRATLTECAGLLTCLTLFPAAARAEEGAARPRVAAQVAEVAEVAPNLALSGEVQARYQSQVAFRVDGKIVRRLVEVGAHIDADLVLAEIDPDQRRTDLDAAGAQLRSAEASLAQAQVTYERQADLLAKGYTTQASYDDAAKNLRTAQAQRDVAASQLDIAEQQLDYTDLRAGVAGVVTTRDAEVGQVVKAGQAIFTIAHDGPRDAVFTVYEALLVHPPQDRRIAVSLQADPSVTAGATVREISPTVDAKTGGVKLKAALDDPPARMALGTTVIGRGTIGAARAITLPWSALFRWGGGPAVWIVGPDDTVSVQAVTVDRFADAGMVLGGGVMPGQRVVTAGVQFLHPGQKVDVAEQGEP